MQPERCSPASAIRFKRLIVKQPFGFLTNLRDVAVDRSRQVFEVNLIEQLQRGERPILNFAADRSQLDAGGVSSRWNPLDEFFEQRNRLVPHFEFEEAVRQ